MISNTGCLERTPVWSCAKQRREDALAAKSRAAAWPWADVFSSGTRNLHALCGTICLRSEPQSIGAWRFSCQQVCAASLTLPELLPRLEQGHPGSRHVQPFCDHAVSD